MKDELRWRKVKEKGHKSRTHGHDTDDNGYNTIIACDSEQVCTMFECFKAFQRDPGEPTKMHRSSCQDPFPPQPRRGNEFEIPFLQMYCNIYYNQKFFSFSTFYWVQSCSYPYFQ